MKLSEAIRLGATMKPQNYGDLYGSKSIIRFSWRFPWITVEAVATSCAIGAAYEAAGFGWKDVKYPAGTMINGTIRTQPYTLKEESVSREIQVPPDLNRFMYREFVCPQCRKQDALLRLIPHLNDDHRWTRERIADFVELHEPLPEPTAAIADLIEKHL